MANAVPASPPSSRSSTTPEPGVEIGDGGEFEAGGHGRQTRGVIPLPTPRDSRNISTCRWRLTTEGGGDRASADSPRGARSGVRVPPLQGRTASVAARIRSRVRPPPEMGGDHLKLHDDGAVMLMQTRQSTVLSGKTPAALRRHRCGRMRRQVFDEDNRRQSYRSRQCTGSYGRLGRGARSLANNQFVHGTRISSASALVGGRVTMMSRTRHRSPRRGLG